MKRALLAFALLLCSAVLQAQSLDPNATLKAYAAKVLPRCADATVTFEASTAPGPTNFQSNIMTVRSSDQYCGTRKYVLYSPKSQAVLIGSVIELPKDNRPANVRISEEATRLLSKQVTANVAPFPLADGLKVVTIVHPTPYGPFAYNGFLDASGQFLVVGFRGTLTTEPARTLRESLGSTNAARRGNAAKVEILELSDFQCPTCARAHEQIEPIIKKNLAKVNYARLDLPLFEHHEWSLPAAMAARAIQRVAPDKYWQYVDFVFKNQESIGKQKIDDVIKNWVEDNDVDKAAFQKIYGSKSERQALLDQVSRAFAVGVASTPTYLVNGQIMGFGPDGAFTMDAINKALGLPPTAPKKKTTPAAK
ncbi:MAG: thioredoxin domain-containing protein [Acidobacteriota bacterium]